MFKLRKVSKPMTTIFRLSGMWPGANGSLGYVIYGASMIFIFSILFTSTMLIQMIAFTKRDELTENSYMALTEFALSVKIVNFFLRSRSMQSHLDVIKHFEVQTDAERKLLSQRLRFAFILLMMDFVLTNGAHVSLQTKVLMSPEKMLTFPAWHPIDWTTNPTNYWLIFTWQLIAMHITCNIQVVIQQYPTLMFCMISTQVEILSMRLRKIGYPQVKSPQTICLGDSQGASVSNNRNLENCLKVHRNILE